MTCEWASENDSCYHGFKNRTGPAGPIGELSGSIHLNEPFCDQTGIELFKPTTELSNRTNHLVFLQTGHTLILQIFVYYLRGPLSTRPNTYKTKTNYKPIFSPTHQAQSNDKKAYNMFGLNITLIFRPCF